jgi:uncharacterized protein (UPF0335 family)
MLKDVEMQIRELYGSLDGSGYGLDAMRLIVVGEKAG